VSDADSSTFAVGASCSRPTRGADSTFLAECPDPEEEFMDSLMFLVVIGTSLWVLVDAKTIGVRKGQIRGAGDMGPWGWFFVCLLLWIVGFPFYLAKRGEYKKVNAVPPPLPVNAPPARGQDDSIDRLERLAQLRDKGVLTEAEFQAKKSQLLAVALVAVLGLGVLTACAKDPKQLRITEANKETFLDELKPMKGLTFEESGLLFQHALRKGMGEAFGQREPSPVGKTVGDLIAAERARQEKEKKETDEQERLAREAKAREEALEAELRKALAFTVFAKDFLDADAMAGRYSGVIIIRCAYENLSGKDVRAFTGTLRFTDLFGKEVFSSGLTISDPVSAGEKAKWTGTIEFNQFSDEHRRFRDAELANLKVVWMPKQVLFADGSKLGGEE